MKRVYVAGKLNDNAIGYINNIRNMCLWAKKVRALGFAVFVPCDDLTELLVCGEYKYDDLFNNSQPWLVVSDFVFVCPGWETSSGTRREIALAKEHDIPVYFKLEDLQNVR